MGDFCGGGGAAAGDFAGGGGESQAPRARLKGGMFSAGLPPVAKAPHRWAGAFRDRSLVSLHGQMTLRAACVLGRSSFCLQARQGARAVHLQQVESPWPEADLARAVTEVHQLVLEVMSRSYPERELGRAPVNLEFPLRSINCTSCMPPSRPHVGREPEHTQDAWVVESHTLEVIIDGFDCEEARL